MDKVQKKKKAVIWILTAALMVEIIICNLSSWQSLFYKERIAYEELQINGAVKTDDGKGDYENYIVPSGILTLKIPEVKQGVHNLHFDILFSDVAVMPYEVSLTDEGNYFSYTLPKNYIVPGVIKSNYAKIYASGEVGELSVRFSVPAGSRVDIKGIGVDAKIPFVFSLWRFLAVFGILVFMYFMLGKHRSHLTRCAFRGEKEWKRQSFITVAVVVVLIGMAWKLAHINPICISSPWPHHKQYQELAEAMSEGKFYLDKEPSEGLLNAPNPYDTIYLKAGGIDYHADYAYRDGKYYVYFGVVPELLLYLPCYLATGHAFPNYMAVFFFYSGMIVALFALYREMIRKWFPQTPFFVYLLLGILTAYCGNYLFVIARPDLYNTPIAAATMFTIAGLWLWIKGKYLPKRGKRICFLAGSFCMALVAGCRPQMLLFSFLAIPLFWEEVIKTRELFSKKSILDTACICLPYLLVAAGIMYYNAARFGSPFDFGATYSLTSNDMTKRGFNLSQLLLGVWHFFFQPPLIGSDFPYLQGNQIYSASYMGKLNSEYTYGGILLCNAFLWLLLLIKKVKKELKAKGIWAFVLVNVIVSAVIGAVDVTGAGILQRYMVDMIWGMWLASAVVLLMLVEKTKNTRHYHTLLLCLTVICLLQAAYGFGVLFGNGDLSVNVRIYNPFLYYKVRSLFYF